jgi:hypothetical protein
MARNRWKGNCYESAFEYVHEMPPEARSNFVIVHGTPVLQAGEHKGRRFGHAWVETSDGEIAIDRTASTDGSPWTIGRSLYYAIGRIAEGDCIRYTYKEACRQIVKLEHWGPWHDAGLDVL